MIESEQNKYVKGKDQIMSTINIYFQYDIAPNMEILRICQNANEFLIIMCHEFHMLKAYRECIEKMVDKKNVKLYVIYEKVLPDEEELVNKLKSKKNVYIYGLDKSAHIHIREDRIINENMAISNVPLYPWIMYLYTGNFVDKRVDKKEEDSYNKVFEQFAFIKNNIRPFENISREMDEIKQKLPDIQSPVSQQLVEEFESWIMPLIGSQIGHHQHFMVFTDPTIIWNQLIGGLKFGPNKGYTDFKVSEKMYPPDWSDWSEKEKKENMIKNARAGDIIIIGISKEDDKWMIAMPKNVYFGYYEDKHGNQQLYLYADIKNSILKDGKDIKTLPKRVQNICNDIPGILNFCCKLDIKDTSKIIYL